jgi:hypothetical protein
MRTTSKALPLSHVTMEVEFHCVCRPKTQTTHIHNDNFATTRFSTTIIHSVHCTHVI